MEDVLYGDNFWSYIIYDLPIVDVIKLKSVCRYYFINISNAIIDHLIIKSIEKKLLAIFRENYQQLKNIIKNTQCLISGSFIIECILDVDWSSDIKFYLPSGENVGDDDLKIFLDEHYRIIDYNKNNPDIAIYRLNNLNCDYYSSEYIDYVAAQKIGVDIGTNKIHNYVVETFDLDIRKNFYGIDYQGKPYVTIYSLNQILNRSTYLTLKDSVNMTALRILRYKKRGFNIQYEKRQLIDSINSNSNTHYIIICKDIPHEIDATNTIKIELIEYNHNKLTLISDPYNFKYVNKNIIECKCNYCDYGILYCPINVLFNNIKHIHIGGRYFDNFSRFDIICVEAD